MKILLRWGHLGTNGTDAWDPNATPWTGFAQTTVGGLEVREVLSFERGDHLLPRENRVTVQWESHTSTGWDGLVLALVIPRDAGPRTYFTVHAGRFTHVFAWGDLPGDHVFDLGGGNQLQVRAGMR